MKLIGSATTIQLLIAFTCNLSIMGLPECYVSDLEWDDLSRNDRFLFELDGWDCTRWSYLHFAKDHRWYSSISWKNLSSRKRKNLMALGWDEEDWEDKADEWCDFYKPIAEVKPWSRLTPEEQNIAKDLGYNQLTWHVKEFETMLGDEYYRNHHNITTHSPLYSYKEFEVIKLKLDIPELSRVTFDELAKRNDVTVEVDDNIKTTLKGDDESAERIKMTLQDFTRRILRREQFYIKYEDEQQDVIREIAGTNDVAELIKKALIGTPLEKLGDFGAECDDVRCKDFSMFYAGAEGTKTTMHLDLLHFNFLYVVSGIKRVRLLPNDQRTSSNFTLGHEINYSVWNDYDLLFEQPLPPHAVEVILGPGEGLYIPYYTWHAVENLTPSIAFGLIRDFGETASLKKCFDVELW